MSHSFSKKQTFSEHDPLTSVYSEKSTYESLVSCCGSCAGTFRAWLPCCCCCCPYPFFTVDQGSIGLLQEFGRYQRIIPAGMHRINPCSDQIVPVNLRTFTIKLDKQIVLSRDNITSEIDAVLYYRISDPIRATYRIQNIAQAIKEVTYSVLRSICGERTLQEMLEDRVKMAAEIAQYVDEMTDEWGIYVENLFIKDQTMNAETLRGLALAGVTKRITEAKIISAKADVESAKFYREAADMLDSKAAMQIRYLDIIQRISKSPSHKVLMMNV